MRTKIKRKEYIKNKRLECFNKQKGLCYYCERRLQVEFPNQPDYATIEHIIRKTDGGTLSGNNAAVACGSCNCYLGKVCEMFDLGIPKIVLSEYGRNARTAEIIRDLDYRIKIHVLKNFIKKGYTTKDRVYA